MTQRGEEGDLSRLRNLIVARLRDCPPFLSTNRPMVSLIARPYPDQLFTPKRPAKIYRESRRRRADAALLAEKYRNRSSVGRRMEEG